MPWNETIRKRYERTRWGIQAMSPMGNGLLSVDCFRVAVGSPAQGYSARHLECDPVYRGIGLRAVASTEGLSACFNGALLFPSLAR